MIKDDAFSKYMFFFLLFYSHTLTREIWIRLGETTIIILTLRTVYCRYLGRAVSQFVSRNNIYYATAAMTNTSDLSNNISTINNQIEPVFGTKLEIERSSITKKGLSQCQLLSNKVIYMFIGRAVIRFCLPKKSQLRKALDAKLDIRVLKIKLTFFFFLRKTILLFQYYIIPEI